MPGQTLFLVHADQSVVEQVSGPLASQGWDLRPVEPDTPGLFDQFAVELPVAVVFSLDGATCTQVTGVAAGVLADERIVRPLMIFIGGDADAVSDARAAVPYGVFVSVAELPWVLKRMVYKA